MSNNILIDTHVWLWLVMGDERLTEHHKNIIEKTADDNSLFLSKISIWETLHLLKKDRLVTNLSADTFIDEALKLDGLNLIELTVPILKESVSLPGNFHNDPSDCIITATARVEDMSLVTYDKQIISYAKLGFVKLI